MTILDPHIFRTDLPPFYVPVPMLVLARFLGRADPAVARLRTHAERRDDRRPQSTIASASGEEIGGHRARSWADASPSFVDCPHTAVIGVNVDHDIHCVVAPEFLIDLDHIAVLIVNGTE